jgi:hypothetical protein
MKDHEMILIKNHGRKVSRYYSTVLFITKFDPFGTREGEGRGIELLPLPATCELSPSPSPHTGSIDKGNT